MTDPAAAEPVSSQRSLPCLRSQGDLVDAVPYILGFHPGDSLVVVLLQGAPSQVVVTMRYDLSRPGLAEDVVRDVVTHASLHGADRLVLIVYSERPPVGEVPPEWPLASRIRDLLRLADLAVADLLYVSGGRWRSYLCVDRGCCPPDGRPLSPHDSRSAVATAAAQAGLSAQPDQATLAATLAPPVGDARASMECALAEAEAAFVRAAAAGGGVPAWRTTTLERVRSMIDRAPFSEAPPRLVTSTDEAAELLVALSDPAIRDYCWLGIERGVPGDGVALWTELVGRAVPPYDAAPLFLLGWAAWRRGDGVLARMAAEQALISDDGYLAARLLLAALDAGLDPRSVPDLRLPDRCDDDLEEQP